jgi:hypothetical protein
MEAEFEDYGPYALACEDYCGFFNALSPWDIEVPAYN